MKLDLSKPFDRTKAESYLKKLIAKKAKIELTEFHRKRSNQQNKYFHVACAIIGDYTGYSIEEVKVIVKREFGSFMIYEKNGTKFLRSSADLDKMEFMTFVDWLITWANEQGIEVMTPEVYYEHQFDIERDYQNVK